MDGWILLYRKLSDNKFWTCEPFTRGQAWVDLLLIANHKKTFFYIRGNKISVDVGQIAWSEEKLAERWQWSRTKLRKFINDLKKERQIEQRKGGIIQIITINNYEKYQKKDDRLDNRKTTEERQKNIYKECTKNVNNVKEWDEVFFMWLNYKSERNEPYKKIGMQQMINKLIKLSDNDHEKAQFIIQDSMANNWAGIFPLKKEKLQPEEKPNLYKPYKKEQ